jgi:flagellar basal body rod protein FlgG
LAVLAGPLFITGNALDVSIEGPGFLAVRRVDGSRALTRAGDLHVDACGFVVTWDGERLDPPLVLPVGASPDDLRIAADGRVTADGVAVGRVVVVDVPAPEELVALGGGLYAPRAASGAPVPASSPVRQGTLEGLKIGRVDEQLEALLDIGR